MLTDKSRLTVQRVTDEDWIPAEQFGLPPGVEYRIYKQNEGDDMMAVLVKFPPGYLEPEHIHPETDHWGVIVEGEMHVDGHILRRGDFHYAPKSVKHGPFFYPKGCIVFGTGRGPSALHEYTPEAAAVDPRSVLVEE